MSGAAGPCCVEDLLVERHFLFFERFTVFLIVCVFFVCFCFWVSIPAAGFPHVPRTYSSVAEAARGPSGRQRVRTMGAFHFITK